MPNIAQLHIKARMTHKEKWGPHNRLLPTAQTTVLLLLFYSISRRAVQCNVGVEQRSSSTSIALVGVPGYPGWATVWVGGDWEMHLGHSG